MKEDFIQYLWQFGLFDKTDLKTHSGENILIHSVGQLNGNEGPDFLHASVTIGSVQYHGSIEIHLKTSDWLLHKHSSHPGYNNVVLHVVYYNDLIFSPKGIPVLSLKLKYLF